MGPATASGLTPSGLTPSGMTTPTTTSTAAGAGQRRDLDRIAAILATSATGADAAPPFVVLELRAHAEEHRQALIRHDVLPHALPGDFIEVLQHPHPQSQSQSESPPTSHASQLNLPAPMSPPQLHPEHVQQHNHGLGFVFCIGLVSEQANVGKNVISLHQDVVDLFGFNNFKDVLCIKHHTIPKRLCIDHIRISFQNQYFR